MIAWATIALLLLTGCATSIGHERPRVQESNSEEHVLMGCEFKGLRLSFLIPLPPTCLYEDSREGR